jgi:hypothetical protein
MRNRRVDEALDRLVEEALRRKPSIPGYFPRTAADVRSEQETKRRIRKEHRGEIAASIAAKPSADFLGFEDVVFLIRPRPRALVGDPSLPQTPRDFDKLKTAIEHADPTLPDLIALDVIRRFSPE